MTQEKRSERRLNSLLVLGVLFALTNVLLDGTRYYRTLAIVWAVLAAGLVGPWIWCWWVRYLNWLADIFREEL